MGRIGEVITRTWQTADKMKQQRGRLPQDSADHFAGQLGGKVSDSPIQERYQGGAYTVIDYTRKAPPPGKLFGK